MAALAHVLRNPWVRVGAGFGAAVALCLAAYLLSSVLVPLFIAFTVAYVFDPVVDVFEKRKFTRMGAIVILVLLLILVSVLFPLVLLPSMIIEAQDLIDGARLDVDGGWLNGLLERLPWQNLARQLGADPAAIGDNPRAFLAEQLGRWIQENALAVIQNHARELADVGVTAGASIADILRSIANAALAVVLTVGNFALFAFVAIYLLKDYDVIVAHAYELIPPRHRARVGGMMGKIDVQLRAFMRGQAMVCACLGTMYVIGLWLSDTPFALTLGLFGGAASFVPYLGLALTILPATLLTVLKHGIDPHILGVLATFAIAQGLEGNFLTPRIVGEQVGLGPVWVILAVMVFGSSFGFMGLLLAVPIAACLKVLVEEGIEAYTASAFFAGPPPEAPPEAVPAAESTTVTGRRTRKR